MQQAFKSLIYKLIFTLPSMLSFTSLMALSNDAFENKWTTSNSLFLCEMKYDLPGFGKVYFSKKSGVDLNFSLTRFSAFNGDKNKKQELIMYVKNPDWVDSGSMMTLGSLPYYLNREQAILLPPSQNKLSPDDYVVNTKKIKYIDKQDNSTKIRTKQKLIIPHEQALKLTYNLLTVNDLWQALESGSHLVFTEPSSKIKQSISPVGFGEAKQKYQECLANMVPYEFEKLKLTRLYFPSGSTEITSDNIERLNILIEQILNDEYISKIEISGHSDIVGGYSDNRILANRRLWTVKDYLVYRGVPADLIEARAYGDTKPIAPHNSKEGRAKNRRVEIKLYH